MKHIISILSITLLFSGCLSIKIKPPQINEKDSTEKYKQKVIDKVRSADYNEPYADTDMIYQNLNGAIVALADQLFVSNTFKDRDPSIILTSFVDLNKFGKTTTFGRLISESLFNELHIRNFKVTDFRGQAAVSVNADGEFHITRDVDRLKDHIEATEYIVVGTYVGFENDSVLINSRILDSETGAIISTARIIYKPRDCRLYNLCNVREADRKPEDFGIDIVPDHVESNKMMLRPVETLNPRIGNSVEPMMGPQKKPVESIQPLKQ